MNVRLTDEGAFGGPTHVLADEGCKQAVCAIDPASGVEVEVRQIAGGKLAISIHGGKVTMHPRAAGIWIEVEQVEPTVTTKGTTTR